MKNQLTPLTTAGQKAIIRDCLDKITTIGKAMEQLFPRITTSRTNMFFKAEKNAHDIHGNHIGFIANSLSDIYAYLIEKEVCHG